MLSRKFTTREIILLIILALLLVTELYIVLVHQRVERQLEEAQARMDNAAITYEIESVKASKKADMVEQIQTAEKEDRRPLPDFDNSTNVIAYLNGVMASTEEYNLVFNKVSYSNYVAMRAINMSFRCMGYATVKSIVSQLEDGPYYCEVTGLSMSADGRGINHFIWGDITLEDLIDEGFSDEDVSSGSVSVQITAVFYEYAGAGTK